MPEKGPVMLLYELFSDIQFECVQTDGSQFCRFKMRVKVNEEVFEGTGKDVFYLMWNLVRIPENKEAIANFANFDLIMGL